MVFLASFVDAIAGGGGLISLPAYLLAGVPMHSAVATNKLSSSTGTVISTDRLCKNKYVDWILVFPCIIMAVFGSSIGANISLLVSEKVLKIILIPVVIVVAFYVMKKKDLDKHGSVEITRKKQMILCAASALVVGIYDGFYGPGTGTFLIIAFTVFAKLDLKTANAQAKIINLTTNVTALCIFLINGRIAITLGLVSAACNMAGGYIGAGLAMKNGSKIVKPSILFVLFLLALKVMGVY